MSAREKFGKILRSVPKALGITLVAYGLSMLIALPFNATTSVVMNSPEKSDLRLTDMFAQVADNRPVRDYDDRIVLVDIGIANRHEIAEMLQTISLCGPKAVGLDVNFSEPGEDDTDLFEALAMNPGIVTPIGVAADRNRFRVDVKPFYYDSLPGVEYGVVTLPAESEESRIREYRVDYPLAKGTAESFVAKLAEKAYPGSLKRFREHGEPLGLIKFHSRSFPMMRGDEIADRAEELQGKIVIVGSATDVGDIHPTPVNTRMPGMEIHAHALATLIDGAWPVDITNPWDKWLAMLFCFAIVLTSINLDGPRKGLYMRVLQVVCAFLAVRIGYGLFVDHDLLCGLTDTLLMITFGLFAVDVWNGLADIFASVYKKLKILYNKKKTCGDLS